MAKNVRVVLVSETSRPVMGYDRYDVDGLFAIEAGIRDDDLFYIETSKVA